MEVVSLTIVLISKPTSSAIEPQDYSKDEQLNFYSNLQKYYFGKSRSSTSIFFQQLFKFSPLINSY